MRVPSGRHGQGGSGACGPATTANRKTYKPRACIVVALPMHATPRWSGKRTEGGFPLSPRNERVPDVRKIAVLRANALGDFLFVLPALDALRAAYPDAEITLLGSAWHADLLRDRPGPVGRVVTLPVIRGVNTTHDGPEDLALSEAFYDAMRQECFDLAVQMHGGGRFSNPLIARLGARVTLGLKTPDAAPLDRVMPYIYYQSEVVRYLELVVRVGAAPVTLEPRLAVTASDLAEADAVLPPGPEPLVALHPGASDPRRRWPPAHFAAVGDALAASGMRVVVTGTDAERDLTAAVVRGMTAPALNLCGRLSLCGLTGVLSRCAVMVANDTGPLHLAGAVGTPSVGIYWVGNALTAGAPTRTDHRPLIAWRLDCPVCGTNCIAGRCDHRDSFVADVSVAEAVSAAQDLLAMGHESGETNVEGGFTNVKNRIG